jgi:hypothetical protein
MSGDERREEYRRLQGIIHSFFVLQDYNLKIVINIFVTKQKIEDILFQKVQ